MNVIIIFSDITALTVYLQVYKSHSTFLNYLFMLINHAGSDMTTIIYIYIYTPSSKGEENFSQTNNIQVSSFLVN